MPDWKDETSLPYVRSLIKEIHRYAPIGTLGKCDGALFTITGAILTSLRVLGIPHCATTDDVYEGSFIPKGTIVFPNLTALSKDPERYPSPDIFEPDRFKGDNQSSAASALSKDHMQRDHFHYGFGRRVCPGVHVAEASLFIVISRILWGFCIKPKPGHVLDMNAKTCK